MINGALVASLSGIAATIQIHVAKICQQYGLNSLQRGCGLPVPSAGSRKAVYAIGLVLNHTAFGWALLANSYAPSMYFTAMFGLGLPVHSMMLSFCLGEHQGKARHLSITIIAVGSILACLGTTRVSSSMLQLDSRAVLFVTALFVSVAWIAYRILSGKKRMDGAAVAWGVLCGGSGALDPLFKSLGQTDGVLLLNSGLTSRPGLVPVTTAGWLLFGASFLLGAAAFLLTQYAYIRHMQAGALVAAAGISTVLLPVILTKVLYPSTAIPPLQLAGLVLILIGFVTMFKNFRNRLFAASRLFVRDGLDKQKGCADNSM